MVAIFFILALAVAVIVGALWVTGKLDSFKASVYAMFAMIVAALTEVPGAIWEAVKKALDGVIGG